MNGRRSQLSVIQGSVIYLTEDEWIISVSLTHYTPLPPCSVGWHRKLKGRWIQWVDSTQRDGGLGGTQRDKNGTIGRLLYNLSQSAFETKILFLPCAFKGRDQNIESPPLCELLRRGKTTNK